MSSDRKVSTNQARKRPYFLALGNEVNIYFANHPEDLEPYLKTWQEMRKAIRKVRPDLPTGTTLAFHEAINNDRLDLVEPFKGGDFLAYTYYPHGQGFRYDGDTGGFGLVLEQMIDASGETPFLIVENGWATAASLAGSEAKQAAYLASTFKALTEHRDSFDRHIWYNLHDGRPENCATSALSFFPPDFDATSVGEFWGHFEDYLCTLGLRYNDGQPKEGWGVFQESLSLYTGVS